MTKTLPLTPNLLFKSLTQTGLLELLRLRQKALGLTQPWKIGLCVSGGPDSMVLAHLLQHMSHPQSPGTRIFSPCAFIVDHGARDGSYEEALWVKSQLEAFGVPTHITKLEWPTGLDPKTMLGFEKEARIQRYRALASMAEINCVNDLFTGHHLDDQVETVFLRMLRDRSLNPLSFQGMPTTSALPECDNIPGVNSSTYAVQKMEDQEGLVSNNALQLEKFSTGLRLHRPLLPFAKSRLLATCENYNVPYVQDKTNFNPSLTPRNAVRHLRAYFELPKALQSYSILQTLTKARSKLSKIERHASGVRKEVSEFRMYSKTGTIYLQFESLPAKNSESFLQGFSYFICRTMALLSPLPSDKRAMILDRGRTEKILTMLLNTDKQAPSANESIVFNKVSCQRIPRRSLDTSCALLFSRQPMRISERESLTQRFDTEHTYEDEPGNLALSKHLLWDHRVWIQIAADTSTKIKNTTIRAYEPADALKVKQMLQAKGCLQQFEKLMSGLAPGPVRYTLPVLVAHNEVIAFPTLDLPITPEPAIKWQVRYPRDLRSAQFLFSKIEDGDILSWKFGQSRSPAA